MFNICQSCGLWSDEQAIESAGPYAICPHCGHKHPFRQLPLFIVTGPSGVGKSTLSIELAPKLPQYVCLDSDILWGHVPATAADDYRSYWNVWLNLAVAINQSGHPILLFGTTLPDKLEASPYRRYFTDIHYLALVCSDEELAQRLRDRPAWRHSSNEPFITDMLNFTHLLQEHASSTNPPMTLLDLTGLSIGQTAEKIAEWLEESTSHK
ncbi:MAG TPA: AAA family ATPase [Ktedonobacteraceae bacterium]|nr:AAA family ATPase [Ktedonobacteraceae bacterium]